MVEGRLTGAMTDVDQRVDGPLGRRRLVESLGSWTCSGVGVEEPEALSAPFWEPNFDGEEVVG